MKAKCRYCEFIIDSNDSYGMRRHLEKVHAVVHATLMTIWKHKDIEAYFVNLEKEKEPKFEIKTQTYRSSGRNVNEDEDMIRINIDIDKNLGHVLLKRVYEFINNSSKNNTTMA